MLERGWGVWMPRAGEITQSLQQHQAADRAAAAGLGWFNSVRCGIGPFSEESLTMQVEYVSDAAHWMGATALRNQEFIRIRNDGPEPVSIDGWTLRVGNDRSRRVPGGGRSRRDRPSTSTSASAPTARPIASSAAACRCWSMPPSTAASTSAAAAT